MINPFVSIDQQLLDIGYVKQYEGPKGFIYAKNAGGGNIHKAEALKAISNKNELKVRIYDPGIIYDSAVWISEKELLLFSKKLKEWKGQYERKDNN